MIDKTMCIKLLPAPLIITKFVKNESNCNYEIYLRELLNSSKWFKEKYPEGFVKPEVESSGQCDAINAKYQIDFKLFAGETVLRARKELYPQMSKLADGVVAMGVSKKINTEQVTTRIFAAVRGLSLQQLKEIRDMDIKDRCINKDIQSILETLETEKNLLLFFPYIFSFDLEKNQKEAIESITAGLENDFSTTFQYRQEYAPNYDTFFTCIYDEKFLIYQIVDNRLNLCDIVKTIDVPTYNYLKDSYQEY